MANQQERTARTDFFVPSRGGQPVEVRIAWPYLTRKRDGLDYNKKPIPPEEQEYEVTCFVAKTAAAPWECQNYMAVATPLLEAVGRQWAGGWPGQLVAAGPMFWPIVDCDLTAFVPAQPGMPMPRPVAVDYLEKNPWARGHWRFTVSSKRPPKIVGADNNDIPVDAGGNLIGLKGGDYGFISMSGLCYLKGNAGMTLYFEGFKKSRDGEPVAGIGDGGAGRSAQQMFGGPAPVAPTLPPQMFGAQVLPPQAYGAPAAPAYAPPAAPAYGAPQPGFTQAVPAIPVGYPSTGASASIPAGAPGSTPGAYPSSPAPAYAPPPGAPVAPPAYPGAGPVAPPAYGTR